MSLKKQNPFIVTSKSLWIPLEIFQILRKNVRTKKNPETNPLATRKTNFSYLSRPKSPSTKLSSNYPPSSAKTKLPNSSDTLHRTVQYAISAVHG